MELLLRYRTNMWIMRTEKKINRIKEIFCWIYAAFLIAGIVYASCTGMESRTPGEIIYEINHIR